MYHYIRDPTDTKDGGLKTLLVNEFHSQVRLLKTKYEMATLDAAIEFLEGKYKPSRDICLLTFDDGLVDHYLNVTPILLKENIQGLFFLITSCLEYNKVIDVHKNHFLMAHLTFKDYKQSFLSELSRYKDFVEIPINSAMAKKTYRWDNRSVAEFKFLINYLIADDLRAKVLKKLFAKYIGDEEEFSKILYLSWSQAKTMQEHGMILGGHSHSHRPYSMLSPEEQKKDIIACIASIRKNLKEQTLLTFSYPYGKSHSFDNHTVNYLVGNGVCCAFTSEHGDSKRHGDLYSISRIDAKTIKDEI